MSKTVKVHRTITISYSYPFTEEYCGTYSEEDVIRWEKENTDAVVDAITFGDFDEDVNVVVVEE